MTTTPNAPDGFRMSPRRWVGERTFAWCVGYRRPGKEFELMTEAGAAMIHRMVRLPHPAR